jgi:hypothetical protein
MSLQSKYAFLWYERQSDVIFTDSEHKNTWKNLSEIQSFLFMANGC